jgi:hypothetical protein
MTEFGDTLTQTVAARALFGDETRYDGLMRSVGYRWFMAPDTRDVYPTEDHPIHARAFTAGVRAAYAKHGPDSRAGVLVDALLATSPEFAELWNAHEIGGGPAREKRLQHPEVGIMELQCQSLHDLDQGQVLLVLTATPGTEDHEKLQLLSVIGTQDIASGR